MPRRHEPPAAGTHRRLPQKARRQSAAKGAPADERIHRQPLYGRPPFPVGHQPQDHLRGALRRAPGILAQGTDRLPRNLSPGTASAARNRRPGICRAVDEHDPRPAPERHGPRGTPALLPDDTPRRGDPEGHRTDRPQTVSFAIRL